MNVPPVLTRISSPRLEATDSTDKLTLTFYYRHSGWRAPGRGSLLQCAEAVEGLCLLGTDSSLVSGDRRLEWSQITVSAKAYLLATFKKNTFIFLQGKIAGCYCNYTIVTERYVVFWVQAGRFDVQCRNLEYCCNK